MEESTGPRTWAGDRAGSRASRAVIRLALGLALGIGGTVAVEAGEIYLSVVQPAAHPLRPSSRDRIQVYFRETDWLDSCPPELQSTTVGSSEVVFVFEVDPESGCAPQPTTGLRFSELAFLSPLPAGEYEVQVWAPDFTTREPELTTATLRVDEPVHCGLAHEPAATVLLPYFEVDWGAPGGRDTLFSIGNASTKPVLAHAVVWTNWGIPILSFDLFLLGDEVRSFDVRDVLEGKLPASALPPGLPAGYDRCVDPLELPEVDAVSLRAALTGQPHPQDGLCYASEVEAGRLATGYVTVDVVRDCSGAALQTPGDEGYFAEGGLGLATNDNVLWGDWFLVDPARDVAQGEALVSLVADVETYGRCLSDPCPERFPGTFYGWPHESNRMPLPKTFRSHFLNGGSRQTDLVVFVRSPSHPAECGLDVSTRFDQFVFNIHGEVRSEAGDVDASGPDPVDIGPPFFERASRLRVGGERLPTGVAFGTIDFSALGYKSQPGPPIYSFQQIWVMPLITADDRFSVGMSAAPIEDFCRLP